MAHYQQPATPNRNRNRHMSFDNYSQNSGSTASTPVRNNSGRPPLPARRAKPNRLPPTASSLQQPPPPPPPPPAPKSQRAESPAEESLASSTSARSNATSVTAHTTTTLGSIMKNPLESLREGGEQWRKHGKLFRAKLLMRDEESGGNTFVLSSNCNIERYYDVAEKVLEQFLKTSIDIKSELSESYLIGNRLVKFLSTVLPTHQDYHRQDTHLVELRNKSQAQLVKLLQHLEQLALIIDEDALNNYILHDLDSQHSSSDENISPKRGSKETDLSGFSGSLSPIIANRSNHSLSNSFSIDDNEFSNPVVRSLYVGPALLDMSNSSLTDSRASPTKKSISFVQTRQQSHISLLQNASGQYDSSAEWDAQFSEFGRKHKKAERLEPFEATNLPSHNDFFALSQQDDFGFPGVVGNEWNPSVGDPFANSAQLTRSEKAKQPVGRKSMDVRQKRNPAPQLRSIREVVASETQIRTSAMTRTMKTTTNPKPKNPSAKKIQPSVDSISTQNSHETPTKSEPLDLARRESSPKSVVELASFMELAEWSSGDQQYIRVSRHTSDDCSSIGSHEEEMSLTSLRRKHIKHFKGCVKCLLD